jgi:hypothetical protein
MSERDICKKSLGYLFLIISINKEKKRKKDGSTEIIRDTKGGIEKKRWLL